MRQPSIPYVDSSGKHIVDKCNVHGARLNVTYEDIEAYSREREREGNRNTENNNQCIRPF